MIQIQRSSSNGAGGGGVGSGGASQYGEREAQINGTVSVPTGVINRLEDLRREWPGLESSRQEYGEFCAGGSRVGPVAVSGGPGHCGVDKSSSGPATKLRAPLELDFFALDPSELHCDLAVRGLFRFSATDSFCRNMLPIDNLHRYDDPLAALLGRGEQPGGRFEVTFKWDNGDNQSLIFQSLPEGTSTNENGEVGLTVVYGLNSKGREQVRGRLWWLKLNEITTVNRAGRLDIICGPASNSADTQQDPFGPRRVEIREHEIDRLPHHLARFQHVEVKHRNLSNETLGFVTCKMVFLSSGPLNQHDGTKTSQDYVLGLIKAENNWEVAVIPWKHVVTITPQSTDHNGTDYLPPNKEGYIPVGSPTFEKS